MAVVQHLLVEAQAGEQAYYYKDYRGYEDDGCEALFGLVLNYCKVA